MDYSQYYQKWLHREIPSGVKPTSYEILGLENGEPNLGTISSALNDTLDALYQAETENEPEILAHISAEILQAQYILLDPARKLEYDQSLLGGSGGRVWMSYVRPTFLQRCQQWGLIFCGLALGCVIMFMMAFTVERNPDGSIAYQADLKIEKAKPFTLPLTAVVYRPFGTKDYREDGYAVSLSASRQEAESAVVSSGVENADPKEMPLDAPLVDLAPAGTQDMAGALEGADPLESEFSEIAAAAGGENIVLGEDALVRTIEQAESGEMPADQSVPASDKNTAEAAPQSQIARASASSTAGSRGQSPLYGRFGRTHAPSSVSETADPSVDAPVSEEQLAESGDFHEMPPVQKERVDVFSPQEMLDLFAKLKPLVKEGASESAAFAKIQYETSMEILRKCSEPDVSMEPEFAEAFAAEVLELMPVLGKAKMFDESAKLGDELLKFGERFAVSDCGERVEKTVQAQAKYREEYEKILQVLEKLKADPDDPKQNEFYAVWLWKDNLSVEGSLPYLAKVANRMIQNTARLELAIQEGVQPASQENLRRLADAWWSISEQINSAEIKQLLREHARSFYQKVDSSLLSEEQLVRISSASTKTLK